MDCMRAMDSLSTGLQEPIMVDLPFRDQIFQGTGDFLDRHLGIDPMLVEQVDSIGFEPLEHTFRCDLDVLRTAVQPVVTLSCLSVDIPAFCSDFSPP